VIVEMIDGQTFVSPEVAEDVSDEMLTLAEQVCDGYFDDDERIDWEEFIDRMCKEGYLDDGTRLEFQEYDNPAISKIKRHVRNYRSAS
jgi:3-hydroxyacyl-CoA dehydrogenase